jgi:hypothetical protein
MERQTNSIDWERELPLAQGVKFNVIDEVSNKKQ